MKITKTKRLLIVCSLLAAGCITGGFASTIDVERANASSETTVEMVYGARTRKTENDPGLKFEAKINHYDPSLTYGMLIVPEAAFSKEGFQDNYHAYFTANNIAEDQYVDFKCKPYQLEGDSQYYIAGSIVEINEVNYDMSFVGVAYTYDGSSYTYADVNMLDNARSIAYVAQMALKYEDNLTDSEREALIGFANPGQEIVDDKVLIGVGGANGDNTVSSGNASVTEADSYAELHFGAFQSGYLAYTTAQAYSSITEVKLDVYIPSDNAENHWWGIVPVANASGQDAYVGSDAAAGDQNINKILVEQRTWKDQWVTLTYTVSGTSWTLTIDNQQIATFNFSGGNYQSNGASYIYVCANPGAKNWGIRIDNFSITAGGTTYTENFNDGESGFFRAYNSDVVTYGIMKSEGGAVIGATPEEEIETPDVGETTKPEVEGEGHAILSFNGLTEGKQGFITKTTYSNITAMQVDVYIPSDNAENHWWGFAPVATNSGDAYAASDCGNFNLNPILVGYYGWRDMWVTLNYKVSGTSWTLSIARKGVEESHGNYTYTAPSNTCYIFLAACPAKSVEWGIQMDNFSITADGVTYTDNFNTGESTLFADNVNCATYHYEAPEEDETPDAGETAKPEGEGHAILSFNGLTEGKQGFITKTTYSNITAMQVDVYIPSDNVIDAWWGFAPVATNSGDAYAASDCGNFNLNKILVENYVWKGIWVTLKYKVSGTSWTLSVARRGVEESLENYTYTAPSTTCYIFLGACPARYVEWGIQMDNFSITADGVTYTDNFNTGASKLFKDNVNCATYHYEAPTPEGAGYAILDFNRFTDGEKSYVTTKAYSSITEVKLDVYIPSTNEANYWWGIVPVAKNSGDAYEGSAAASLNQDLNQILVNKYGWKDQWVTLTYTVSNYSWTLRITRKGMNDNQRIATFDFSDSMYQAGGASYIYVCATPGKPEKWGIQIDNFSITAGGVTYTDNFNKGESKLFTDNRNCATYYYEELPAEQVKFAEMLENELLIDHILNSENYIRGNSALNYEGVPLNMAIMEGKFTYSITGYKDVVIALSVTSDYVGYLRLYNSGIEFYSGNTLLKEIALNSTQNTIYISVLANGKVLVQINDKGYVGMGQLSNQATGFAIVDVAGSGSIQFSKILIDHYTAMMYGTDGIDFTAYASMPPANWDGNARNANMITEEQYRLMKEAGFTKVLALYEGRKASAETDALIALAICEELGLEYYAMDVNFYNFVRAGISPELYENGATLKSNWKEIAEDLIANMFNDELLYIDSPAYAGNFAADEPTLAEMKLMVTQIELYNKYVGYNAFYGGEAIVNLLPSYATEKQLGCSYTEYLNYYFENLAPLLGYACFDFYPIRYEGSGIFAYRTLHIQHLYNLQLVAQYCQDYGVEMRTFAQSLTAQDGAGVEKIREIDELRFQIYSALAFGSQEIIYYMYTSSGDTESTTKALVNFYTGETSTMYNWAKTVNNEVAAFGEAYADYAWEKTYFNDVGSPCSQAEKMVSKESYGKVSSKVDTLTGVFTHKDTGKTAYMLVNYTDPYMTSGSGNVTLTLDDTQTVEIWQNGAATTQTGDAITVTLGDGNGAFVIVK